MFPTNSVAPETLRRRALARIYALLIRLAEEKEEQTAVSDNFDAALAKTLEAIPTEVNPCSKLSTDALNMKSGEE